MGPWQLRRGQRGMVRLDLHVAQGAEEADHGRGDCQDEARGAPIEDQHVQRVPGCEVEGGPYHREDVEQQSPTHGPVTIALPVSAQD